MNSTEITPEQARTVLERAQAPTIARKDDRARLARGLLVSGLSAGALVLAARATLVNPEASAPVRVGGFLVAMCVYLAGLGLAQVLFNRVTTRPRGFNAAYLGGLGGSMGLYVLTLVMMSIASDRGTPWPWMLAVSMAVVTTLPSVVATHRISTLDVR